MCIRDSVAATVMMGASLTQLGVEEIPDAGFFSVKESVFPFARFPGVDVILGPEMRSTGEVMGMDRSLHIALAKAQMGAGIELLTLCIVFLSVRDPVQPHYAHFTLTLVLLDLTVLSTMVTPLPSLA